jgi:asparagine synthetase B (glutamine-hydrolysing)
MCGICGLYAPDSHDALRRTVERMVRTIAHRGPDAEGTKDRTLHRAARALPPGHRLVVEDGHSRIEPWWRNAVRMPGAGCEETFCEVPRENEKSYANTWSRPCFH